MVQNKRGKIVTKKQLAAGKKSYSNIKGWTVAVQKDQLSLFFELRPAILVSSVKIWTKKPRSPPSIYDDTLPRGTRQPPW